MANIKERTNLILKHLFHPDEWGEWRTGIDREVMYESAIAALQSDLHWLLGNIQQLPGVPEPPSNAACPHHGPERDCNECAAPPSQGWVEAAAQSLLEMRLIADNVTVAAVLRKEYDKHAPTAEAIAEAVRRVVLSDYGYEQGSAIDKQITAAIQAVLGRGK